MKKVLISAIACLLTVTLVLGLAACGTKPDSNSNSNNNSNNSSTAVDDHLIVVAKGLPISMDPHDSSDMNTAYVCHQIYDTLFRLTAKDYTVEPSLAESYETPDAQTLNIKLREGVKFHNGDLLTADIVKASLHRTMESAHVGYIVAMVDDITVHDDLNLTIKLNVPFAPILNNLAHYGTAIVHPDASHEKPIGTGAFKFDSIALGDKVELSRNDDYWGVKSEISKLTWRAMPEATNRLIEVESGNAHLAYDISPSDVARVEAASNLVLNKATSLAAHYLGMHCQKPPFDDIRVRHAINYAIDIETLSKTAYEGTGKPGTGAITEVVTYAYPIDPWPYDVEKAKQLMAEAGLEDGFDIMLWYNTEDQQYAQMATMIQNMLKEINVNATIQSFEWATYLDRVLGGEQEMFLLSWITLTGDADYGLFETQHSSEFGNGNLVFYGDEHRDKLLEEGRAHLDPNERREIYKEIAEMIYEASAYIYLHHGEELHATTANLKGFEVSPSGMFDLWKTHIE